MTYSSNPLAAIRQVRDEAVASDGFPPPGARGVVSNAIEALRALDAPGECIAVAEQLSVCLFRLEMATWAKHPGDLVRVREILAALNTPGEDVLPLAQAA